MAQFAEHIQTADWKQEKHAPVIECPDRAKSGQKTVVTASVGKEIAHPNTTEHHIEWIQLYFLPDGDKFVYQIATNALNAHAASARGPNEGPAPAEPCVSSTVAIKQSGTLVATSYCNIHGLWESTRKTSVE